GPRGATLRPEPLALRLAAGAREPAPPGEPDGVRGPGPRLRRLPPRHALPGPAQPAARPAPGRIGGQAEPRALRRPARPARTAAGSRARRGPDLDAARSHPPHAHPLRERDRGHDPPG